MTATISPANFTRVAATAGRRGCFMSGVIAHAQGRSPCSASRSAPVHTPRTPFEDFASDTSIDAIVAEATGLRTMARCTMPGRTMLSVHLVRPVMSRASSLRLRAWPNSLAGALSSTAVMQHLLRRRPGHRWSPAPPPSPT